jgi:hypothetical protein
MEEDAENFGIDCFVDENKVGADFARLGDVSPACIELDRSDDGYFRSFSTPLVNE